MQGSTTFYGTAAPSPRTTASSSAGLRAELEQLTNLADRVRQLVAAGQANLRTLLAAPPPAPAALRRAVVAGTRHLVYVHGICPHPPGYSDDWWKALHQYSSAFGDGDLGDTRQEVLWSDLVNERGRVAAAAGEAADGRVEWAARIRGVLEDRAATHAIQTGPSVVSPQLARDLFAPSMQAHDLLARDRSAAFGLNIPGLDCVDDFAVYMFNDAVRAQIIGRFTDVVRPLLEDGAELDIISHSWGTVVAYEGLRQLEDDGLTAPQIRNFFTVGAALSIFLVKLRLRPANRDGHRPALVRRWVNLDANGDPVGGRLQGQPYQVDAEFLNLDNLGCGRFDAVCAHGSYFKPDNVTVNRDIFAAFIDRP